MAKNYDNDFMESLKRAFRSTWNAIASDVCDIVRNPDDSVIIEMCTDSDRLVMFGGKETRDAVDDFYAMTWKEQMTVSKMIVQNWA